MYIGLLEDEPHLAQHVCEILENAGHTTSVFNNGTDMVKAIGRDTDLPPASHTKVMAVSPQILENCGYEDHTIYR